MTVWAPQEGEAGQGEHAAQGEEQGKFSWIDKKHGKERYRKPKTYCTWGENNLSGRKI